MLYKVVIFNKCGMSLTYDICSDEHLKSKSKKLMCVINNLICENSHLNCLSCNKKTHNYIIYSNKTNAVFYVGICCKNTKCKTYLNELLSRSSMYS